MASEMTRWEPARELSSLREEFERMFRQAFGGPESASSAGAWSPALDVEETEDAFVLHVEMPGVKPDDLDVTLDEDVLSINGERQFYEDKTSEGFRRVERRFGRFHRAVRLPARVEGDRIEATYDDGLLTVRVPKSEEAKPRRVEIRRGG
jgi:HSP20 family protein